MRFAAPAALLLTMLFWGTAGTFVRSLALALSPENAVALRYLLLIPISAVGLLLHGGWRIARADIPRLLFASLAGMTGYNLLFNYGLAHVQAGVAGILAATQPLLIAFGAWLVLGEKPSRSFFAGVALALCGAVALFWNDLVGVTGSGISAWGALLVFLSCICWAIYSIACKPLFACYSPFVVTAWTMILAAPPILLNASQPLVGAMLALTIGQWAELLYLIIANALIGTALWNYGNAKLGNASAGAFLYLIPVIAIISGAVVLGEAITPTLVLGAILTLAGVAVAQLGPTLRARRLA
jgi:drug/metabolite transporter (DMT)-like permease